MNSNLSDRIRFSVVIPSLNHRDMLRQAIEALREQEDPDCLYEIIPVDNGSTDGTKELVEELARNSPIPIRYLFEPRAGSHFARNRGFKAARGQILGLIDDDIIVDKNWVKNTVKAYDNPEVSCAGGRITIRWINGSPPKWFEPFKGILGEIDYGQKFIELRYPQMINAGNLSIHKEVLLKVGGYNPCNAPADKLIGDGESGLCSKVYHSSGRIFWVPDAMAWHMQDASRITLSYMCHRAKFNGMSAAYTFYRSVNGNLFKVLEKIFKGTIRIVYHLLHVFWYLRLRDPGFYKHLFAYESNLAIIFYLMKIKTNRQLCRLVCRDDWLNV